MSNQVHDENLIRLTNTLYVVFHGELAFVDRWDSDYIQVYAPAVPTHIYMAGSWLAERHIPQGTTMQLFGVCVGNKSLDTAPSIVRLAQNSDARPVEAHFEIRLPRPSEILEGLVIPLHPGDITINKKNVPNVKMDLRPVFQYEMESDSAYLSDLDNDEDDSSHNPNWGAGAGRNGFYSLHIFAEEDSLSTDDDHAEAAFAKCGQVLGVNKLVVTGTVATEGRLLKTCEIPGLHPSEHLITLAQRTRILADLGKQLREGHGRHLKWHEHAEIEIARLERNNHASCGPIGN